MKQQEQLRILRKALVNPKENLKWRIILGNREPRYHLARAVEILRVDLACGITPLTIILAIRILMIAYYYATIAPSTKDPTGGSDTERGVGDAAP
jgi:hypothetical protein